MCCSVSAENQRRALFTKVAGQHRKAGAGQDVEQLSFARVRLEQNAALTGELHCDYVGLLAVFGLASYAQRVHQQLADAFKYSRVDCVAWSARSWFLPEDRPRDVGTTT